jgi:DNA-binding transcriptional MerR regulator
MPIGKAAEILGVSTSHVHSLDDELHPVRDRHGRRWFDPDRVIRLAEHRAAKRAAGPAPAAGAPLSPR